MSKKDFKKGEYRVLRQAVWALLCRLQHAYYNIKNYYYYTIKFFIPVELFQECHVTVVFLVVTGYSEGEHNVLRLLV